MDRTTALLSEYAAGLAYDDLSPDVVHRVKRALLDAVGCAVGGFSSPPAGIARRMAARVAGRPPSRVVGVTEGSSADMAAFANTVMLRHLDANDVYFSARGNGAHPSDMIPAVLACSAHGRPDGRTALTAVALAYEVLCWCCDSAPLTNLGGWDYGMFTVVGAALGAGKVLGLDREQMAQAISLALVPNVPLGVTRTGTLSMWKGCASAASTRAGTFAAQLAAEGMTGPDEPFEGRAGLWEQLAGDAPSASAGRLDARPSAIARTSLKRYPSQSHTQGAISLAVSLRRELVGELGHTEGPVDPEHGGGPEGADEPARRLAMLISSVRVTTFKTAVAYAATGPARWSPTTKETADHSIPYTVATALLDGDITPQSFGDGRLGRDATRQVIGKMTVDEDPAFSAAFPDEERCRLEVVTRSGRRLAAELVHPDGHRANPLSDAQLTAKFQRLAALVPPPRRADVARLAWGLEHLPDVSAVFGAVGPLAGRSGRALNL